MLYASIALVVAGIALITFSFISRGRTRNVSADGDNPSWSGEGAPDPVMSAETGTGNETRRSDAAAATASRQAVSVPTVREEPRQAVKSAPAPPSKAPASAKNVRQRTEPAKTAPAPANEEPDNRNMAVLYNDASGVVDYESRENVIDPSFKKYSKLRRIGRGQVRVVKDGINFQLRKKLYRFELYRIEKMLPGKNYIALFLKGSDEAKLLIFDRDSDLDRRLINEFRAFKKNSL